ncbi:MAG: DNA primase [Gammaproteobacteria bacterium]|nr:DNA primase [Gammaproteobacteria bacterium]
MKNLDRQFIDNLLSNIDIVELIGQKVTLKKFGNNYKGLCPFHAENTPSFNVSSSKQFYHCFGCGASGDAISFLKNYEGLSFYESIEKLAKIANISIPETVSKKNYDNENLLHANYIASDFFSNNLQNNKKAKDYLLSRGITDDLIEKFDLGYANDSWDGLMKELQKKNLIKDALEVGVLVKNKDKIYDRFRDRVIFPIKNTQEKVIAFGGRTLNKSESAKYINSPESKIFFKSAQLYGLFQAKNSITKNDKVIIVEGYTDVLALHKNNFNYSIATLGTAFTKSHFNKIMKYTKNIFFCFDGDEAGKKAAWKALTNCLDELRDNVNINFIFLPEGKDPDDIFNEDVNLFINLIDKSTPLSEFLFQEVEKNKNIEKIEDKSKYIIECIDLIKQIPKGVFKTLMEEKLTKIANINKDELYKYTSKFDKSDKSDKSDNNKQIDDYNNEEFYILSILIEYPNLISKHAAKINKLISNNSAKKILNAIINMKEQNQKINISSLIEGFPDNKDLINNIFKTEIEDKNQDSAAETIKTIIYTFQKKLDENEYFDLLSKYSKGIKLSEDEKIKLKNFKK